MALHFIIKSSGTSTNKKKEKKSEYIWTGPITRFYSFIHLFVCLQASNNHV